MAKLTDKFKNPTAPLIPHRKALWLGPESSDKNGGVTFSLLSRFICCRERFRLHVVEGLRVRDTFNAKIEMGNMWHVAEEALATAEPGYAQWDDCVKAYGKLLASKYPFNRDEIDHWLRVVYMLFPEYISYWKQHPDVEDRTPLLQEQVFDVAYKLPSGRTVRLRGKWDAVDLVGSGKSAGIYIQENKTKSQIDQQKIARQLTCDLQSMIYCVAFNEYMDFSPKSKEFLGKINGTSGYLKGVRYNVIRRSSHKTPESMYKKLTEDIADGRGNEWFSRWKVEISAKDIENFKTRTLNPLLEQLCDWYDHVTRHPNNPFEDYTTQYSGRASKLHWQHPYGVYNVLDEGGSSDLDAYLETGSETGLQRMDNLFPELNNA